MLSASANQEGRVPASLYYAVSQSLRMVEVICR